MSVRSKIGAELTRRAPQLGERMAKAGWRRQNRDRAVTASELDAGGSDLAERLRRDGILIADAEAVFGDRALFDAAAAKAKELYDRPRERKEAEAGSKATFLTKLATRSYEAGHPFVALALHPRVLGIVNAYMGMRSTLRALDLWLTEPTPGPAIQTQLWHRDGDDLMNMKMFVYFTDVTRPAGPLTYAPRTHPLGSRRELPEHDEHARSTDDQLAKIVPESDWILCEGKPGTVVFADTCGYHKQLKPEGDERLLLMSHYVSGTPRVPRELELSGLDPATLSADQYVAALDRLPA
jgi:hypothetical protein